MPRATRRRQRASPSRWRTTRRNRPRPRLLQDNLQVCYRLRTMLKVLALALLVTGPGASASALGGGALAQDQPAHLMTPLEHVSDPLKRALSSLTHAANQSCDVKAAIVEIKAAQKDLAAAEAFLLQHPD